MVTFTTPQTFDQPGFQPTFTCIIPPFHISMSLMSYNQSCRPISYETFKLLILVLANAPEPINRLLRVHKSDLRLAIRIIDRYPSGIRIVRRLDVEDLVSPATLPSHVQYAVTSFVDVDIQHTGLNAAALMWTRLAEVLVLEFTSIVFDYGDFCCCGGHGARWVAVIPHYFGWHLIRDIGIVRG